MIDVAWNDEYCIGIEEIDRQHIDFIKLLNRFNIVFCSGSHIYLQDRILLEISKYFEYHSVSEENLMIISGYPDMEAHKHAHDIFNKALEGKRYAIKNGSINGSDIIKHLYNHWFLHHTQKEDRLFAEYISKKGNQ